jgi:hypothetical protein
MATYTVGLVYKDGIKTYNYSSFDIAKADLKNWVGCFLNNNDVLSRRTTIDRNECEEIESIRHEFKLKHETATMFLNKNRE